ncbi:cupin domain-containing protein [Arcanobacterium pinnipediorum]|uniref:Cupin domain-containing protein n=1 Tax=Arcanobacterium pinnipediorum TaxID=1503041 RepID=A0ABY5AFD9_9ACTO|nr:cupin domain-containing protein [Arcanobacterium pinnipediorum]USR78919.1 cupin domain-containing protein [Arcanobacterium pinnipediorum]
MSEVREESSGVPGQLGYLPSLVDQIEYAEKSTVSKTVMRAEGVNLVLFSFDEGEELSEHTAAMPVLVQTLEGELEITADGQTVRLLPGGVVHFTTRLPHAVKAIRPSKMALYMLAPMRA